MTRPRHPPGLFRTYRKMIRSPFACWLTLTNGNTTVDVLVTEADDYRGGYYCGYEWPLHETVYTREDDGLPCWGDAHNLRIWRKSEWADADA